MQKAIIIQILTACSYLKDMAPIYTWSNKKSNQTPYKCKTNQDKRRDQMTTIWVWSGTSDLSVYNVEYMTNTQHTQCNAISATDRTVVKVNQN